MPKPYAYVPNIKMIGLDMSLSATGVCCVIRGNPTTTEHWLTEHKIHANVTLKPPAALHSVARLEWIHGQLSRILNMERPRLVAIEGYAHGASFQAHWLGEVGGMARLMLWQMGIPYVEVQPTSLKLITTGSGKAKKKAMRSALKKRWGVDIPDDNQADAYALALVATLATAPGADRMGAGEFSLVSSLACRSSLPFPFPLLSRPV